MSTQKHSVFDITNVLTTILLLFGCSLKGEALAFTTIDQKVIKRIGPGYKGEEPTFFVVANAEEIDQIEHSVDDEAISSLRSLDYDNYFAVAVFQGFKPTTEYSIEVKGIWLQGNRIIVDVEIKEPNPDKWKGDMTTSPYHLVSVEKSGSWGGAYSFRLLVEGGDIIASADHTIH